MSYALVRPVRLAREDIGLDDFARVAGVHPELVRRLVTLGLLEPERGPRGELRFSAAQLAALARVQRLRAGCALNYAAIGLVTDLLDRIAALESELRRARRAGG
jgi:chaperone modulatory protein CbpM